MEFLKNKKVLIAIAVTLVVAFVGLKAWLKYQINESALSPEGLAIKAARDSYYKNVGLNADAYKSGDSASASKYSLLAQKDMSDVDAAMAKFKAKYPSELIPYPYL